MVFLGLFEVELVILLLAADTIFFSFAEYGTNHGLGKVGAGIRLCKCELLLFFLFVSSKEIERLFLAFFLSS